MKKLLLIMGDLATGKTTFANILSQRYNAILFFKDSIKEALGDEEDVECGDCHDQLNLKELLMLAIATSIDALAVGITFAFLRVNIIPAITIIGVTTFIISFTGVHIGHHFGSKYEKKAELAGGIILICIGLKILLEHLGIFG